MKLKPQLNIVSLNLNYKIFFTIFLPMLITSIVSSFFLLSFRFNDLEKNLLDRTLDITEQMAAASEYAITFNNQNMTSKILQRALNNQDINGVQLYNSEQKLIAELGKKPSEKLALNFTKSTEVHNHKLTYEVISPIYNTNNSLNSNVDQQIDLYDISNQKKPIGWAKVESSKAEIAIQKYRYASIILFVFITLNLIAALVAMKIANSLLHPINRISNSLDKLVKGQFSTVKLITFPKEYASIEKDLLDLTERLEHHHEELITGIEQSTEDLRRSMDSMEEKSAQLHIANKEAMESNRLKSQFLANISHEVRTPLNAILGYTKILQKDIQDSQHKIYVDTIEQSTNSLLSIIGDILDFSKIEAGKLNLENSHFNLKNIIDDVYQTLSINLLSKDKQIDLVPEFNKDTPEWFIGDSSRVRQILTNLIGNAIKFTHQGSVRTQVSVLTQSNTDIVLSIQIIDTGIGIPEHKINRLFKPFSQVDTSTTRQFGGTGLGLVITKKLVEQMNGKIEVSSDPSIGTTFRFTIHLKPSQRPIEKRNFLNRSVILLEPRSAYKNYLQSYLNEIGVTCLTCSDLEQMITILNHQSSHIDAILMAVSLNEQSTEETRELIAYAAEQFNIPCILMIQPPDKIANYANLKSSCSDILIKPIGHEVLYNALKNIQLPARLQENPLNINNVLEPNPINEKLKGLKILAVDDTQINLELLDHWLKPNDLVVLLAHSGQQAIDIAMDDQVDLIFMDIQMPEMDGMETTRKLRQLENYKNTPIIALTAHALGSEQQKILASGMNAYLTKPVDENILLNTIETWCLNTETYLDQVDAKIADIFDLQKALEIVDGKANIAKEMFDMLADTLDDEKKLVKHHLENQDTVKLIEVVHRIHGASKYTGTINIAKHAGFLETHLKELGLEEVEGVADDFIEAIEELLNHRELIPWPHSLDSSITKA